MSRNELAVYYSDFHKDFLGFRPKILATTGRAALCALIEQLEDQFQIHKP